MSSNIGSLATEHNERDFHSDIRKKFKRLMQTSILASKRERKAIAADMGISPSLLCDWLNEGKPESMPAHHLDAFTREVGKGTLRWIARENGLGLVSEDDPHHVEVTDSAQLLSLIAMHHGQLMGQIIQAREDGVIDDHERASIWPEIQRLIRELEDEAEYFRPMSKQEKAATRMTA